VPTQNERPSNRIVLATAQIPAEYHDDRLRWWTVNSPSWSQHIDADGNRGALLVELAQMARGLLRATDEQPTVIDFGCGEGAFLRILRGILPTAELQGIDFCPAMLAEARRRSSDPGLAYVLGDLEKSDFDGGLRANVVTSILAIDEMEQIGEAFRNISRALIPGGAAMVVVMDPVKEIERNKQNLGAFLDHNLGNVVVEPVLLVKTFPESGMAPVAPYSRIVRPLPQYAAAAVAAGLRPEATKQLAHSVGLGRYSDTLLFDVLTYRKLDVKDEYGLIQTSDSD
jgi:SAM-dependent methyltransferase